MPDDKLLGLDPADFGTTGLTLGMLVGIAMTEPERVLARAHRYGRGGGLEPVSSWKLRAVDALLRRHGVDLDTPFPAARPAPVVVREVTLERVRTDDGGLRVFEPGGVGTGFLTYYPDEGDKGTVTFDRVNRPAFNAETEAAICHDLLELRDENAVYDRLEYLYRRILAEEARKAPEPVKAPPITPLPGDVWHDACPSFTGGQLCTPARTATAASSCTRRTGPAWSGRMRSARCAAA
jgi:hypothetical protein